MVSGIQHSSEKPSIFQETRRKLLGTDHFLVMGLFFGGHKKRLELN